MNHKQPRKYHAVRGGRPGRYIFRPRRRNPVTGELEHAKDFGKKAFAIWIPDEPNRKDGNSD